MREILLQRYPYLAQVPPDGIDTPLPPPPPIIWDGLGNLIPVKPRMPPVEEKPAEDPAEGQQRKHEDVESPESGQQQESESKEHQQSTETRGQDVEDISLTWNDVALSIAAELMGNAREEVRVKLGYSTSAVSRLYCSVDI